METFRLNILLFTQQTVQKLHLNEEYKYLNWTKMPKKSDLEVAVIPMNRLLHVINFSSISKSLF